MSDTLSNDQKSPRAGRCYRGPYAHRITDAEYLDRLMSRCERDDNGCMVFQGTKNAKGYGQISYRNEGWGAHRLAYRLTKGEITPGMLVLHRCDNPSCCNPVHLFVGTNDDNMADKTRKGRHHAFRAKTCPKGHPYDEQNTYWKKPSKWRSSPARSCKKCSQIRSRMKLGWTREQAENMPVTPKGQRPINGTKK